jgi:hypothetical protein
MVERHFKRRLHERNILRAKRASLLDYAQIVEHVRVQIKCFPSEQITRFTLSLASRTFKLLIKIKQLTRTEIKNDVIPVFRACSQTYSF